ncbi:MAG: ankyrin repeat domain-containing protein [Gemmatimonadetes bacterium]|nr:ankyrin repeat domain-containing protein [Gemmatimonadota bacterium]
MHTPLTQRGAAFLRGALRSVLPVAVLIAAGAWHSTDSPVADAAMRGDTEELRELLQNGADANAAQGDGMTALHWAAERGDMEAARMLRHAGANVSAVTRIGGYAPVHLAARRGSADVLKLLLDAGADPNAITSNSGATALHFAAGSGSGAATEVLLAYGAEPSARESAWGQTPLMFAAAAGRVETIQALLDAGADPDEASWVVNLEKQSELDRAVRDREAAVLDALTGGDREPTPSELQAAVRAGRQVYTEGLPEEEEEEADERRNSTPPSIEQLGGLTPLLHAVREGHGEAAVALLDGGADADRASDADGTTPMVMAAINGEFDLVAMLLNRGADPNLVSKLNGVSPLWAVINSRWQPRTRFPQPQQRMRQQHSYLDLVEQLLKAGADPNHRINRHPWYMVYTGCGNRNCGLVDTNGATAFFRAAYATDVPAMRLLVSYGADPDIPTRAPPRRQRLSPDEFLRQQALNQLRDSSYVELEEADLLELLMDVRESLQEEDRDQFSDRVLRKFSEDTRQKLIVAADRADSVRAAQPDQSGLPPVQAGGPGVFPIHAASGVGYGEGFAGNAHRHAPDAWMPAVRYLVEELGADVNGRDHNGYTAMHNAASRGDDEMIMYLVEMGGDVTVVSRRGQTTADMANGPVQRVSPFPETVALLESLGSHNNDNCLSCD